MKAIYLVCFMLIAVAQCKVYQPCELAKELVHRHSIPRSQVYDWVCLVDAESSFRTNAINRVNTDGSSDHGLFQV